jgi:precorrin-3B methylase
MSFCALFFGLEVGVAEAVEDVERDAVFVAVVPDVTHGAAGSGPLGSILTAEQDWTIVDWKAKP